MKKVKIQKLKIFKILRWLGGDNRRSM